MPSVKLRPRTEALSNAVERRLTPAGVSKTTLTAGKDYRGFGRPSLQMHQLYCLRLIIHIMLCCCVGL